MPAQGLLAGQSNPFVSVVSAVTKGVKVSMNHAGGCCSFSSVRPFFFLFPEYSSRDGLLKWCQPSLLFRSFCSRQLFSLLSLRSPPFYVELISFLELREQSWIYIFAQNVRKGFFLVNYTPGHFKIAWEMLQKIYWLFFFSFSGKILTRWWFNIDMCEIKGVPQLYMRSDLCQCEC